MYRSIDLIMESFGYAVEALKFGKKVSRLAWSHGIYIWLKPKFDIKPEMCSDPQLKQAVIDNGGSIIGLPTISIFQHDSVLSGWTPTSIDILAEDWFVLD